MESQIERGVSKKLIAFDADHKEYHLSGAKQEIPLQRSRGTGARRGLCFTPGSSRIVVEPTP